jgi:hypothetical protein
MSLEWARARLLQHREALRKLCEAQAAARAAQRRNAVATLRPDPRQRPLADARDSGTVLKFGQPHAAAAPEGRGSGF